jgi:GR25 family glycosyltransferase involved in LPS biosynthesis
MYDNLTVIELKDIARKKGLGGYSRLRRDELLKLVRNKSQNQPQNIMNKFFDKIFIINLYDKTQRWEKVSKQFKRRGIQINRFIAIDGRCRENTRCEDKRASLEIAFNVKLPKRWDISLSELIPAASLTITTLLLLRKMVKEKWKHMLICEDDVVLSRDILGKFRNGIKELQKTRPNWDLLYLGCGYKCGKIGISSKKTFKNTYISQLSKYSYSDFYVENPNDLRELCHGCRDISKHLSIPGQAGGTWAYAYSLKGAKKVIKYMDNNVNEHIDQLLMNIKSLQIVSFDPPIIWHEGGSIRSDSDIPWKY